MTFNVDDKSPPGAWVLEWDARSHTPAEYRAEIRELRKRIRNYVSEIAQLREQLREEQSRNAQWIREP